MNTNCIHKVKLNLRGHFLIYIFQFPENNGAMDEMFCAIFVQLHLRVSFLEGQIQDQIPSREESLCFPFPKLPPPPPDQLLPTGDRKGKNLENRIELEIKVRFKKEIKNASTFT